MTPDLRALAESGLTAPEIAARTGLSLSAVRGRLRRLGVRLASSGPGRPRKDGTRARVVLQVPLSAEEHAGLVVAAGAEDVATWARRRILPDPVLADILAAMAADPADAAHVFRLGRQVRAHMRNAVSPLLTTDGAIFTPR